MGLSSKELAQIRETLATGKRPRVVFTASAGQIAGQIGHVVRLDDPKAQEDWILVKFGADVLPFPPADLAVAPRGAVAKPAAKPAKPVVVATPQPEFKVVREQPGSRQPKRDAAGAVGDADRNPRGPVGTADHMRQPDGRDRGGNADRARRSNSLDSGGTPAGTADRTGEPGGDPAGTADRSRRGQSARGTHDDNSRPADPAPQESTVSTPDSQAAAPAPRRPASGPKAPKVKPVPSFTVTLSYTEGEWTVGAIQGSKTLAKPYVIKPAEALKMVGLLDVPGVHEAVDQIMSAERSQAQAHAEKLRAELAELEVKLAELGA